MSQQLYVLIGVVIGLLGAPLTELVRDWLDRRRNDRDRRTAFQRDTLIELQDVLTEHFKGTWSIYAQTAAGRIVPGTNMSETINETADAKRRAVVLCARVSDDETRGAVDTFLQGAQDAHDLTVSQEDAKREYQKTVTSLEGSFKAANDRIGAMLRELL